MTYYIDKDDPTKTVPYLMRNLGLPEVLAQTIGAKLTLSEVFELTPEEIENRILPILKAMSEEMVEESESTFDADHSASLAAYTVWQLLHPEELWAETFFLNYTYTRMYEIFPTSTDEHLVFTRVKYEWLQQQMEDNKEAFVD